MEEVNFPIHPYPADILKKVPEEQRGLLPKIESIPTRKYATSIDARNYLSVYEYCVRDNWIIWDYHSGLVHLTGLWKAIGNSKADIVKLLDSSPELEKHLKRIRGGYLKIQGTWISYEMAKLLASKFCYTIRYALIPLFGADFVDLCLKPYERGFGMLRLHVTDADLKRRRRRRCRRRSNPAVTSGKTGISGVKKPQMGQTQLSYAGKATLGGHSVSFSGQNSVQSAPISYASFPAADISSRRLRSRSLSSPADVAKLLPYPTMSKVCLLSIRYTGVQCSTAPSDYAFSKSADTWKKPTTKFVAETVSPRSEGILSVLKAAQNLDSSLAVDMSRETSTSSSNSVSPTYSRFNYTYNNYPVAKQIPYDLAGAEYRSFPVTARVSSGLQPSLPEKGSW